MPDSTTEVDTRTELLTLPIPGCHGYHARSDGTIWTNYVIRPGGRIKSRQWSEKLLPVKTFHIHAGYYAASVGLKKYVKVHHLILLTFHGPRPEGAECRHLDGNNQNNSASNLKWGTREENGEDQKLHGRMPRGVNHQYAIMTPELVREIRAKHSSVRGERRGYRKLAEEYNCQPSTIRQIVKRITWDHVE